MFQMTPKSSISSQLPKLSRAGEQLKSMVQLPGPFAELPRHPILYNHFSPIHPLPSLSTPSQRPKQAGINIYAKREDHGAPLACAGNKYRKLEYIVPDILSPTPTYHYHEHHPTTEKLNGPATILVTEGAIQSNHTVQVAALAHTLGLKALVLLSRGTGGGLLASHDQDAFVSSGNVQINRMLGAEVRVLEEGDPISNDANPVLEELRTREERPYWIPGGASLHALGGLGYARAAFEIETQERELNLKGSGQFDYIFVACGSGSTLGGLIAGFKLGEPAITTRQIIGVLNSPTKPRSYHEARVLTFARRAAELIGFDGKNRLESEHAIITDDVRLEDRFVGTGYGILDAETKEAMEVMAKSEGIILDPVYTGKVARAMMQWVREHEIQQFARQRELDEVNVLFIHTGGQAALGAYADVI
ncbi:hypothetical protein N7448_000496 [Penicillium atrosanguineum]|uniref:uncharacterized protein n=1 Tax=Penicillium atrosanguineum TaxID=1132637 RepID=UPI0023922FA5|nr:uncharacterized protein N7443_003894 [Penicillium atrosanguineum]KAJ5148918.1 hypothetical protein N7448_000496 [Penicillium atrosanguineum]KAJ5304234.1 hypothetical protein N7443_003894 [Penicillium atrosanguineum]